MVTITTPWLGTGAEKLPVFSPRSLCAHKSRTLAERCAGYPMSVHSDGDVRFRAGTVQQRHGAAAIRKLLRPNLQAVAAFHAAALAAQRILIDGDHFLIRENVADLRRHAANVVAGHQRRGQQAPHAEVRAILGGAHAAVAHLQHVGIVPVARPGVRFQAVLQSRICTTPMPPHFSLPSHLSRMSPVVRHRLPTSFAHSHGFVDPHSQRLNTMGRPDFASASRMME